MPALNALHIRLARTGRRHPSRALTLQHGPHQLAIERSAQDALGQQAVHAVLDAGAAALVAERQGSCAGQSKTFIDLLEQQHAAITDDVATVECGLDDTPANTSKFDSLIGTLWHRQSSVAIGGQIPMTTGSATRLPTYCL